MNKYIKMFKKMLIFFEFSWIFMNFSNFFEVFENIFFNHSGPQPSTKHHKILCEILRRTYYMGSLWGVVGKSRHVFYRFYGGWNLRRFSQNPINLHLKSSQNHRTVLNNNRAQFHEKPPAHFAATYAIIFFYQNF